MSIKSRYRVCGFLMLLNFSFVFALNWPILNQNTISSVFGPRAISGSSGDTWCHTGVDIANCMVGEMYYAPFALEVVAVGTNRLDCKNTSGVGPEYVRFEHVYTTIADPSTGGQLTINVGDIFTSGTWITTIAPWSGGTHLHFDTWAFGYYWNNDGYVKQKQCTAQPFIWFSSNENDNLNTQISTNPNSGSGVYPTDAIGKYIQVVVTQSRPNFTYTGVELTLNGTLGENTWNFCVNENARIGWNAWDYATRSTAPTGSNTWVVVDNIKILPAVFNQYNDKVTEFRFYLKVNPPALKTLKVAIKGKNSTVTKEGVFGVQIGVFDKILINGGPMTLTTPSGSVIYTSRFKDEPPVSRVDSWNWKMVFYHQGGEYLVSSIDNLVGYNASSWNVPAFTYL